MIEVIERINFSATSVYVVSKHRESRVSIKYNTPIAAMAELAKLHKAHERLVEMNTVPIGVVRFKV